MEDRKHCIDEAFSGHCIEACTTLCFGMASDLELILSTSCTAVQYLPRAFS